MPQDQPSIAGTIETIAAKYEFCRNRLWEATRSLEDEKRNQLLQIPATAKVEQTGSHEHHDQCTFDFCEHSRLDFTAVPQRHEACTESQCDTKWFNTLVLEKAIEAGMPTAWKLAGASMIEPPQPFMAISHVWSDGTGTGAWPPGQVNQCLYDFFKKIAEQFQCKGIWWDTICIPTGKAARSKAIVNIYRNYKDARITLVHDVFLRNWEWVSPEIACFAIIISPWFSRGWTALELAKSHKVKMIFKGPQGPVIKDLDEDILAKDGASHRHLVASQVIENLRQGGVAGLNQLLTVLGPRHTSWPRDVATISGQLAGITIPSDASQQGIYQEILKNMGEISHGHLFHNSTTMSKGFTWCPPNLFDIRQASTLSTLSVGKNGDLTGEWNVFSIPDRFEDRYNWKYTHPLVEVEVKESLKHPKGHWFLVDPQDHLPRALLVKTIINDGPKRVSFVGPMYFYSPPTRQEFDQMKTSQPEEVTIVGATVTEENQRETEPQTGRGGVGNSKESDLLSAAAVGDLEKVLALRALGGFDPNIWDEHGRTALHLAAQNGHDKVMEELVKNAVDLNYLNLKDKSTWTPLHYATWNCYPLLVQRLLRGGADKNLQDRLGQNALHLAAERGNVEIVDNLLREGADLRAQCDDMQTALHRAAWGGSTKVVELLLAHDPNLNICDKNSRTALHIAAEKGQTSVVRLLLHHGADREARDSMDQTALHLAAQNGHEVVVGLLLAGIQLELENHNGLMPLLLAVRNGHRKVVNGHEAVVGLLLADAQLELEDYNGLTPLLLAVRNGHRGVVNGHEAVLLADAQLELKDYNGLTPLLLAVRNGHGGVVGGREAVVGLLLADAQLKLEDRNGLTPLLLAASNGHRGVVEMLLPMGAPVESRSGSGKTPLMWAAEKGHKEVVGLLLSIGADLTAVNSAEQTPLLLAAENGHTEVVELLYKNGAVLEGKDSGGQTPLLWAAEKGHASTVEILLHIGADPETKDGHQQTPLLAATKNGHEAVVRHLLKKDVNLEARDKEGRTSLSWAAKTGKEAIARLLLDKGGDIWLKDREIDKALDLAADSEHEPVVRLLLDRHPKLKPTHSGQTLQWAASKGHAATVGLLLDSGVGIESKGDVGQTALLSAAGESRDAVVDLLLKRGADVRAKYTKNEKVWTALSLASIHKSEATLRLLLENGAALDSSVQGGEILLWALSKGHETVAGLALGKGAEPDAVDKGGRTPLSWAAEKGFVEVVKTLLQKEVKRENRDKHKFLPLEYAATWNEDTTVVELLLGPSDKVVYKDEDLGEALNGAVSRKRPATVELLLMRGAKTLSNKKPIGSWVLEWAVSEGHWSVAKQLLKTGVKVEYEDQTTRTALSWAAEAGNEEMVRLLLDNNANLETRDAHCRTPLFYAVGHIEVVKLMLERGADRNAKDEYGRPPAWRAEAHGYRDVRKLLKSSQ